MHGLVNRSIQSFVSDTYGGGLWASVASECGVSLDGFEAMLHYDDQVTHDLLDAIGARLDKGRDMLLEDLGTYLVSNHNLEALRRLLRFGGVTFLDFLHSLEELNGRASLALPDLDMPQLSLLETGPSTFRLTCRWGFPGAGALMSGILRGMADDYGALVLLEGGVPDADGTCVLKIELLDSRFSEGRQFDLAVPTG
ncbi:heme NO-binding domain-containing protein [Actibacterium ureilyticum]|uniref:heme NO-binding domain-containing protein n=1 Tax=Actibacterium ureilyticum TaxID=1590614 RepID=UPI000BAAE383|nr:heme NO-binding domain-containing protein [Actibacterium ureilyticum]